MKKTRLWHAVGATLTLALVACGGMDPSDIDSPTADAPELEQSTADLANANDQHGQAFEGVVMIDNNWMADPWDQGCTGTLVSRRHILTAGHCVYRASPDPAFEFRPDGQDHQNRGQWYPIFPNPKPGDPALGLTSGAKLAGGAMTTEVGADRLGYDLGAFDEESADNCKLACSQDANCNAYTHVQAWNKCFKKKAGYRIRFGSDLWRAPTYVATAVKSNVPWFLDIILLELDQDVPAWVATPFPVLTDVPEYDADAYLGALEMQMIGYGGNRRARQWAPAELAEYPFLAGVDQPNMLRVVGTRCTPIESGDSGGPLLAMIRGRWTVAGVTQGSEGCGGRYVTPFTVGGYDLNRLENDIAHWLEPLITQTRSDDGTVYLGDTNGDGKDDILCHDQTSGHRRVARTNSSNRITASTWNNYGGFCRHDFSHLFTGDFNGDGRMDLLCHTRDEGYLDIDFADAYGRYYGNDWSYRQSVCDEPAAQLFTGDFNGDGKDDILCRQADGRLDMHPALWNGTFSQNAYVGVANFCTDASGAIYVGDYNGDGRDDLLCHHKLSGRRFITYSSGTLNGVIHWVNNNGFCSHAGATLHVGDFDGDGRDDNLCHTASSGWRTVDYANNGLNGPDFNATNSWCTHAEAELRVADFNADGRTDLLCHTGNNGGLHIDYADSQGRFGNADTYDNAHVCLIKQPI